MITMEIFGFSGKIGSGKNYVSEKLFLPLLPQKQTLVMALADHFKVDACSKDNLEYEKVFINKDENTRRILQIRGTEEGRLKYGEDIWTRTLDTWIRVYQERGIERIIITDVRFKNEVEWVKSKGGKIIRIISPNRTHTRMSKEAANQEAYDRIRTHASEIGLDNYHDFDYVIHNDYTDEDKVINRVRDIVVGLEEKHKLVIFCDLDDTICKCNIYYNQIINHIAEKYNIKGDELEYLLYKYVNNFNDRYFVKDDFAKSLIDMVYYSNKGKYITEEDKKYIYQKGMSIYDYNYEFITDHTKDSLMELSKLGKVVIFTLGDRCEQMKKIVGLGLNGLFDVEVFPHKDENIFRYLKYKYKADKYVMIGDSYKRDILPAIIAELDHVIHISQANNENIVSFKSLSPDLIAYLKV